jgi:hypothetical protein
MNQAAPAGSREDARKIAWKRGPLRSMDRRAFLKCCEQ